MSMPPTLPGDSEEARECRLRMVENQIAGRGISDSRVLRAFRDVPRHLFCSEGTALATAYADHPLPIGLGQTISQPLMVAEMTARLALRPGDTVLEVGTGSGYQAAILSGLVAQVHTVERIRALAGRAQALLQALGYTNVFVHDGDGTCGWPDSAPYDAIVVTAAAPNVPDALKQQMADGGRLAIPVGSRFMQDLVIIRRHGERIETAYEGGCRFVPLVGEYGWPD